MRRVALTAAALLLVAGLAVLCWPIRGADIRSTALYPNYDHLLGPPATRVRVAVTSDDDRPRAKPVNFVVRDRRHLSASLVTAGLLTLGVAAAVRRRDDRG